MRNGSAAERNGSAWSRGSWRVPMSSALASSTRRTARVRSLRWIGLQWPWLFKLWGILTGTALFTNTLYAFRRFGYNSRVAVVLGSVGTAAIYLSLNCPSLGETKDFSDPRCVAHWLGALIFAFLIAAPVVMFLYHMARTEKGLFRPTFYGFVAILLLMIILLVTVGKSALIENLPIVAAYLILLAINFTNLYEKPSS